MSDKLRIEGVYKIFGPDPDAALELSRNGIEREEIFRQTQSTVAVDDVSFSVEAGQIFVIMGLSGSGKSTLIRCINRLFEPTRGKILLDDDDVTRASEEELRQIRLRRMAMVFQHFALLPHKTVLQNAEYGLKVRGMDERERRQKALEALKSVGLQAWADSRPSSLSGGMQQRVGLARGLAVDPEVLLMDEPFSALDPLIRRDMQDELIEIQRRLQTTIVFITHDLGEALRLGDQVAIMKEGRFVQVGTPEQIVINPSEQYVAEFTEDVDRSRVLTFGTIMHRDSGVASDADVATVCEHLLRTGRRGTFVVDNGKPIGRIDVRAQINNGQAHDAMTADFSTIRSDACIFEGFDRLESGSPLAVVDGTGRLVGVAEVCDVFHHLQMSGRELLAGRPEAAS